MLNQTTQTPVINSSDLDDLFSWGKFEGRVGIEPRYPENINYWTGWCSGAQERYITLQGKAEN